MISSCRVRFSLNCSSYCCVATCNRLYPSFTLPSSDLTSSFWSRFDFCCSANKTSKDWLRICSFSSSSRSFSESLLFVWFSLSKSFILSLVARSSATFSSFNFLSSSNFLLASSNSISFSLSLLLRSFDLSLTFLFVSLPANIFPKRLS